MRIVDAAGVVENDSALSATPIKLAPAPAPGMPKAMRVIGARPESTPGVSIVAAAGAITLEFVVPGAGDARSITETEHTFTRVYPAPTSFVLTTGSDQPDVPQRLVFDASLLRMGVWVWRARARRGALMGAQAVSTDGAAAASGVGFAVLPWIAPPSW